MLSPLWTLLVLVNISSRIFNFYLGNWILITIFTCDVQLYQVCELYQKVFMIIEIIKCGFFSEISMRFSNLQNKYSKSLSWAWNLNKLFIVMGGKFKFQVQDSDLEYLFWRFDKHIALSEKKLPLVRTSRIPRWLPKFFLFGVPMNS